MARLNNKSLDITGSFGFVSLYKMKGHANTIARVKGGASKQKIRKSPKFALTRLNNAEFGGAAKAGSNIRWAMTYVKHLADHNVTPALNSLCRTIMTFDKVRPLGEREINFSQYRYLLPGFKLNKQHPFDSVVKHPLACDIDRKTGTATIQLPALLPGINLSLPWQYPMYRIILTMGIIFDRGDCYTWPSADETILAAPFYTPWRQASQTYEAETIVLKEDRMKDAYETMTFLVAVGIEMGTFISDALIQPVKYAGSAKILMAG